MEQITVARGDTLSEIAKRFKTSVEALAKLNKIANPNKIREGAVLTIPDAGPAAQPKPKPPAPVKEIGRTDSYPEEELPPIDIEFVSDTAPTVQRPMESEIVARSAPEEPNALTQLLQTLHTYIDPARVLTGHAGETADPSLADYLTTASFGMATPRGTISPPTVLNEAAMMRAAEMRAKWGNKPGTDPAFNEFNALIDAPQYGRLIGGAQPIPVPPRRNFTPVSPLPAIPSSAPVASIGRVTPWSPIARRLSEVMLDAPPQATYRPGS